MFVNDGTTVGGACFTLLNVLFTLMNDIITLIKSLNYVRICIIYNTNLMVQDLVH